MTADEVRVYMRSEFERLFHKHWDCPEYDYFVEGFDAFNRLIEEKVLK